MAMYFILVFLCLVIQLFPRKEFTVSTQQMLVSLCIDIAEGGVKNDLQTQ